MSTSSHQSEVDHIIHDMKHFLPSQVALKDFIHHNTLHSLQHLPFHEGLKLSNAIFGTKVYLSQPEYIKKYNEGKISEKILKIKFNDYISSKPEVKIDWDQLFQPPDIRVTQRVGEVRRRWMREEKLNLDPAVHPLIFRWGLHFLDQGISGWGFPKGNLQFLNAMRELERNSMASVFLNAKGRARELFMNPNTKIERILDIIVGDKDFFERYLFDQQFSHPGWSGLVSAIEDQPETLYDKRQISLRDYMFFELCLELDHLDYFHKENWRKVSEVIAEKPIKLFSPVNTTASDVVLMIWQQAFEWTLYDTTLSAVVENKTINRQAPPSFQAVFCIDDRECSFRRYVELIDPECETLGAPGFFGIDFYYHAENSHHLTKLCPAPVNPKHVILEKGSKTKSKKDLHYSARTHSFWGGLLTSYVMGYWSALKLFWSIFRPSISTATATSLHHTDKVSDFIYEYKETSTPFHGLQIGYSVAEMTAKVSGMLRAIGLTQNFAPLIYFMAHGSSTTNNPHYAAYDCGACSGRPGSINSRLFANLANDPRVRKGLSEQGINIPATTLFVAALHDTTRDEVVFFDEKNISNELLQKHEKNKKVFNKTLDLNAKERSRRFNLISESKDPVQLHDKMQLRSVSLFEPRPELNHATNAFCIVGRRNTLTRGKFFDRRSFLNSYDPTQDASGNILSNLMNALAPVCGGINLEYYFSRVDNNRLGAGTKLPHNVMGLIAVANGTDGDLRPGLPSQMIELHDPVRLLFVIEQKPDVALSAVTRNPAVYEWIKNDWVTYTCMDPDTRKLFVYKAGVMTPYEIVENKVSIIPNIIEYIESDVGNLTVGVLAESSIEVGL